MMSRYDPKMVSFIKRHTIKAFMTLPDFVQVRKQKIHTHLTPRFTFIVLFLNGK